MVVAPERYSYEESYLGQYWEDELIQESGRQLKKKKQLKILPITVIILSFILLNMGLAMKTAGISMANISLDNLNKQLETLENEKSNLLLEVARLKSIDRIELAARNNMQMIYANEAPSVRIKQTQQEYQLETIEGTSQDEQQPERQGVTWGRAFFNWLEEKTNLILG